MNSRTKNYIRGLASGYVVTLATIIVGLWLTPFTLRYLDREQFAVFTLASDVLIWLGLLDIGLISVLNSKMAQMSSNPNSQLQNLLVTTTFFAQSFIAIIILIVGLVLAFYFPYFFSLRPDLQLDATNILILLVVGSVLSVGTQTFSAILVAHQQIHIDNIIRLILLFIRTVLTIILLTAGFGMISLAIANLVAVIITSFLAVYRAQKLLPSLTIHYRLFSWDTLRESSGMGIWFSIGALAGILIMNFDRIVTAKIVSVAMVTTLALTGRLYGFAWSVIQQITNTARPALAQLIGDGKIDRALDRYYQMVTLSTGLAIIMAGSIFAGNGSFITWWVGENNYGGGVLDILLAMNLIVISWVLPNRVILGAGLAYIPQNAVSKLIEGILNLGLSVTLGYLWGVKGIIFASIMASIVTSCYYSTYLTAKYFKLNLSTLLKNNFDNLRGLAVCVVLVSLIGRVVSSNLKGITGAFLGSSMCSVFSTLFFIFFVVDKDIKSKLIAAIQTKLNKPMQNN